MLAVVYVVQAVDRRALQRGEPRDVLGLPALAGQGFMLDDTRGEIMVALYNQSNEPQVIAAKERIAQLVIAPFLKVEFEEVDELTITVRGAGGFGSTGTK